MFSPMSKTYPIKSWCFPLSIYKCHHTDFPWLLLDHWSDAEPTHFISISNIVIVLWSSHVVSLLGSCFFNTGGQYHQYVYTFNWKTKLFKITKINTKLIIYFHLLKVMLTKQPIKDYVEDKTIHIIWRVHKNIWHVFFIFQYSTYRHETLFVDAVDSQLILVVGELFFFIFWQSQLSHNHYKTEDWP